MHAETRLAIVLFGSFVLWFPALSSVLRGDLDAGAAGIRWGFGAAFVWLMVTALHQLIASYALASATQEPRRRADDAVPGTQNTDTRDTGEEDGTPTADPEVEQGQADLGASVDG